jgi:hypothetical protein
VARLDPGEDENDPAQWDNVGGALPPDTTSLGVGGLATGGTYKFKVRCRNACGAWSAYSNVATVAPQAPKPATPTNLSGISASATSVLLTWQDNADNESAYRVAKLDPGEDENNPAQWDNTGGDLPANTTSHTVAGLLTNQTYKFKVRCESAAGVYSDYSNVVAVTPACTKPATPGSLAGSATSPTTVLLTWIDDASGESAYRVAKLDQGEDPNDPAKWDNVGGDLPPNTTSHVVTGLVPGQAYKFKVRCQAACGTYSDYSNIVSVTPSCPPPSPAPFNCLAARITTTPQPDPIQITWSYSGPPVTGFRVARLDPGEDASNDAHWDNVGGDLPASQLSYLDEFNLENGKTYKYKVRTFINAGVPCGKIYSAYSNIDPANP